MKQRTPITVLTGADEEVLQWLSGALPSTAYVVHDPKLLEGPLEFTACACCRTGTSITRSLMDLFRRQSTGEVPEFERIILTAEAGQGSETLSELARSPMAAAYCRIASFATLDTDADALIADHRLQPEVLDRFDWLEARTLPRPCDPPRSMRAEGDQSLESFVIGWDEPHSIDAVGGWLQDLIERVGNRLLRLHGSVQSGEGLFGIQASGHALAPPIGGLPVSAPGTRLRFVTIGLEPGDVLPGWPAAAAREDQAGRPTDNWRGARNG
jgi:hypothetical protein